MSIGQSANGQQYCSKCKTIKTSYKSIHWPLQNRNRWSHKPVCRCPHSHGSAELPSYPDLHITIYIMTCSSGYIAMQLSCCALLESVPPLPLDLLLFLLHFPSSHLLPCPTTPLINSFFCFYIDDCTDIQLCVITPESLMISSFILFNADWQRMTTHAHTHARTHAHTHTHTHNRLTAFVRTTRVGRYQKKHSRTHTQPDHQTSFIIFLHLQRSTASSLFILRAWQSSRTTSLQVLLGLEPSTSYSIHFFTQSAASFRSTCPYQRSLFCCKTNAMSSIPSLSQLLTWKSVF